MPSFFAQMYADGQAATSLEVHGESVAYVNAAGERRSIIAIVDRNPPDPVTGRPGTPGAGTVVIVRDHATLGIAHTELKRDSDRIELAVTTGEAATSRIIAQVERQEAGMLQIKLR